MTSSSIPRTVPVCPNLWADLGFLPTCNHWFFEDDVFVFRTHANIPDFNSRHDRSHVNQAPKGSVFVCVQDCAILRIKFLAGVFPDLTSAQAAVTVLEMLRGE